MPSEGHRSSSKARSIASANAFCCCFSLWVKDWKGEPSHLQAFQKLIYVSYQVFGAQKASFLLPFARTLGINPGGIDIANREVAKQLFQNFLAAAGGELPVSHVACQTLNASAREHKVPRAPLKPY